MKQPFPKLVALGVALAGVTLLLGLILVTSATGAARAPQFFGSVQANVLSPGSDLVVYSITLEPAIPDPGVPATINVTVRNLGDTAAGPFRIYLYIDPADRPPTPTTPDTSWTSVFGLPAGGSYTWSRSHTFTSVNCDHAVYAWVDRDNQVVEDDEGNNLHGVQVCVGTTPTPTPTPTFTPTPTSTPCASDGYEPDGTCPATAFIEPGGAHQARNLCPEGDVDWVSLQARAGITYTIETTAVGEDGDTALSLHGGACGAPLASDDPPDTGVARIVWPCTETGEYQIRVAHHSETYGQASEYELSVTASTLCPGDLYESDDSCAAARDIMADGMPQTHLFCAASDHDWIKLRATTGSKVIINTQALGPNADPMLSVLSSCGAPSSLENEQQLEWVSPSDTVYYVKMENHNPELYGPTTAYNVAVTTLGCNGDDYEFIGDDDAAEARLVSVAASAETHNVCPAGDEDWVKFAALAGKKYVIDTFHLDLYADTALCLYGPDGTTEIACDDDGSLTKAARIVWTCPESGTYYVQARHYDPNVSGPITQYDLDISIGFQVDGFEPDSRTSLASPLEVGVPQVHNFAPIGDEDWVKFTAAAGSYALLTSNLEPGCDTIMELYDSAGNRLQTSDDFAYGLGSQILFDLPASGTYYAHLRNYRPERFGTNMQYQVLLVQGTPPPAPTPPALATPTPPPAPPPSSVKTLILFNRDRLRTLYGSELTNELTNKLVVLAGHPRVLGNLVQVETDAGVAAAYAAWTADQLSTTKANDVAAAVRNLVLTYLSVNPNTEYIIIVGSDEVIPFRRTLDRTSHPESTYAFYVSSQTTTWAACLDDMSLTDNYYADRDPTALNGHELYVPDYAVGRLIETPQEIMAAINLFLGGYSLDMDKGLVTGYDFVQDAAGQICGKLRTDLGESSVNCTLIGETWTGDQLRTAQLNTVPRYDVQSINGHASRAVEGVPSGTTIKANEIATLGSSDLSRALVYTLGCHSGLNDTGNLPTDPTNNTMGWDLAQAFTQRGANYIANTGYGWGYGGGEVGLSERLMVYLTEELVRSSSNRIGTALMSAKQRYYAETPSFGDYDEKILIESTLYGLPMVEVQSSAVLDDDLFPSVAITTSLPFPDGDLTLAHLNLSLADSFDSLDATETVSGTFFELDGSTHLGAGEPVQPKFFADVSNADAGQLHGAVLTGATYQDQEAFDPVVLQAVNEYYLPLGEPEFQAPGWFPTVPLALHDTATISGTGTLVATLGQYHATGEVERIYDAMTFDVFYSDSYDWWEPTIVSVDGTLSTGLARVKVEAIDGSGINRVVITYTFGDGSHVSVDLAYDAMTQKWKGQFPAVPGTTFYAQVVDGAGNVAIDDNKGAWHTLVEVAGEPHTVYLPVVIK